MGHMISDVRGRIINSAISLFAEKGFHETKVDEIAEKSNVAKGTVYLYFKSKEEILEKAIDFIFEKAVENYELDEKKSFLENLKNIIQRNAEFVKKNIEFYKVMFNNVYKARKDKSFQKKKEEIGKILSMVSNLIDKGIKEGVVRKDISIRNLSILLTNLILSSMMNIVLILIFEDELFGEDVDLFTEDLYRFAVSAVMGGNR